MEDSDPLFPPWKMDVQSQCKSTWQHGVSCLCAENAHVLWVTRSWLDPFPAHRAIQSHICTWASHETVESWNVYKLENKLLPIYKYIYIYIPMTTWLNCESDISSSHQRQGNYHHGLGPGPYCIQHNILRFFFFLFFLGVQFCGQLPRYYMPETFSNGPNMTLLALSPSKTQGNKMTYISMFSIYLLAFWLLYSNCRETLEAYWIYRNNSRDN